MESKLSRVASLLSSKCCYPGVCNQSYKACNTSSVIQHHKREHWTFNLFLLSSEPIWEPICLHFFPHTTVKTEGWGGRMGWILFPTNFFLQLHSGYLHSVTAVGTVTTATTVTFTTVETVTAGVYFYFYFLLFWKKFRGNLFLLFEGETSGRKFGEKLEVNSVNMWTTLKAKPRRVFNHLNFLLSIQTKG